MLDNLHWFYCTINYEWIHDLYAPDNVAFYDIGTVATYACDSDFILVGDMIIQIDYFDYYSN